ncbi:MAG: peroxiredoxin [Cyanobium sp. M30B3]|jgi:thioredoxin-dependent peroxiredoxin|nr:MAG: peroxiredoxin [Cyanobium sp. M30B3]
MDRRRFLQAALTAAGASIPVLLASPAKAVALGGTLPDLDQPAPPFDLAGVLPPGVQGRLSLSDLRGSWLVLYFYPRDFTGGCTLEARGFQRDLQAFQTAGAAVVGVSADDPDSHASFCSEEGLAFPLLSDPGGEVSRAYGSWIAPFSQRHTFLIDPNGILRSTWLAVRPSGHSQEVLSRLHDLQLSPATQ